MKFKFFCLSLLFPLTALAGWSEEFCISSDFPGFKIVNFQNSPALTCGQVQAPFEEAFSKIQKISPVKITSPLLIIYNKSIPKGATYDWTKGTFELGLADVERMPEYLNMFYHEMGHKIYFSYLAKNVSETAIIEPYINQYVQYALDCLMVSSPATECAASTAVVELNNIQSVMFVSYSMFLAVDIGYEELFSDVVAALAAGDKDVTYKNIISLLDPARAVGRSFSKNEIDFSKGGDPYLRFSYIRKDIWDKWIDPRLNNPSQLLNDLAEIFTNDCNSNYQSDSELTSFEAARAQIARLQKTLGLQ